METITINIPDKKSTLVKSILRSLGVVIQEKKVARGYKEKIAKVAVWNDDDLKSFDTAKKSFESLNQAEW